MNLWQIIREAITAVPTLKWGLGVIGMVAMILLITGYSKDYLLILIGVAILFVPMIILVLFAWLAENAKSIAKPYARIIMGFAVLCFIAVVTFTVTSIFFCWPRPIGSCQIAATAIPSPIPSITSSASPLPAPTTTPTPPDRSQESKGGVNQSMTNSPGGMQAGRDINTSAQPKRKR